MLPSGDLVMKVPCGFRTCDFGKYLISNDSTSKIWANAQVEEHRRVAHGLADGLIHDPRDKSIDSVFDSIRTMFN